MNLKTLSETIRFDNASKGFDPLEGGIKRYLLLVISEICEAQNELRDGRMFNEVYHSKSHDGPEGDRYDKPEGFPVEIADAAIRILDIQAKMGFTTELLYGGYSFPLSEIDNELLGIINSVSHHDHSKLEENLQIALSGLFQIAENCQFPMMKIIEEKLAFNRTRPPKHGRKF